MSSEAEAINETCCASCGVAEEGDDDIKLKNCTACHLVKFCGVKCQMEHRPQHKRACKKRAAELCDEILFKQPESSHMGDCPICCLPLPLDGKSYTMMACCSKQICRGCGYTNAKREIRGSLDQRCPFCRHLMPKTQEDAVKDLMRRVEANDPVALCEFGSRRLSQGDHESALECWTKAVDLGDVDAHFALSSFYRKGECVEKDMKKVIYHAEQAAIGGHPGARYNLGCEEHDDGRKDRAVKHWIIAAKTLVLSIDVGATFVSFNSAIFSGDYSVAMSSEAEAINDDTCCASCGVAEGDDVKLKKCTAYSFDIVV